MDGRSITSTVELSTGGRWYLEWMNRAVMARDVTGMVVPDGRRITRLEVNGPAEYVPRVRWLTHQFELYTDGRLRLMSEGERSGRTYRSFLSTGAVPPGVADEVAKRLEDFEWEWVRRGGS